MLFLDYVGGRGTSAEHKNLNHAGISRISPHLCCHSRIGRQRTLLRHCQLSPWPLQKSPIPSTSSFIKPALKYSQMSYQEALKTPDSELTELLLFGWKQFSTVLESEDSTTSGRNKQEREVTAWFWSTGMCTFPEKFPISCSPNLLWAVRKQVLGEVCLL